MRRRTVIISLLAMAAVVIVGLLLFRWRFVIRQFLSSPEGEAIAPKPETQAFVSEGRARVVMVTRGTAREMVRECLTRLRAEDQLEVGGRKVLVKPNVVAGSPAPTTTSPEVVAAVCEWLMERGAETVWVGDMSAVMSLGTRYSMRQSGIEQAAMEAGATPVYFEEHEFVPVRLERGRYLPEIPVSEFITRADLVINLPVIKSHKWATYSVCMKNFVGATHARYRPYMIDSDHWEEIVTEINLAYQPSLNIVDGTKVMHSGGPWRGEEAAVGLVLAGGDRVACDAVAVALMKTFPTHQKMEDRGVWEQTQIRHARELRLGITGPEALDLEIHHLNPPGDALEERLERMRRLLYS